MLPPAWENETRQILPHQLVGISSAIRAPYFNQLTLQSLGAKKKIKEEDKHMANTILAIYENGVFRPLQTPGLEEHQRVHLLVIPDDPTALVALQQQALKDLAAMSKSGRSDISTSHDAYLYRKE